MIRRI